MSDLIENLNWRYATKRMNGRSSSARKTGHDPGSNQVSPSPLGLQPYNDLVISDQETKDRIYKEAAPQPQIPESSICCFCSWEKITSQHITDYMNLDRDNARRFRGVACRISGK